MNLTFFLLLDYLSLQLLMMQLFMVLILDIISVSLGAFHAMKKGILTSTDRKFFTKVKLGNNRVNDNVLKIGSVIESKKLSVYGLLV